MRLPVTIFGELRAGRQGEQREYVRERAARDFDLKRTRQPLHGYDWIRREISRDQCSFGNAEIVVGGLQPAIVEQRELNGRFGRERFCEYLLDRLASGERVFLVGHDLGGPTAYAWACAYPQEVRRLAILDVAITIDEATAASYFTRLFHLSFHAVPDIAVQLVSGRERVYLTHFYRECYNPGAFTHADVDEYVAAFSAPGALRASMAHYGALWTDLAHNKENAKTKLEMPVLALGGEISFRRRVLESCSQSSTLESSGLGPSRSPCSSTRLWKAARISCVRVLCE